MVDKSSQRTTPEEEASHEEDVLVEKHECDRVCEEVKEDAKSETQANDEPRIETNVRPHVEATADLLVDADEDDEFEELTREEVVPTDPKTLLQQEFIRSSTAQTELEIALTEELMRKEARIERLTNEILKLKAFISKRKQTYKRKRKDEGAPTRALSAYNIYVQERFSKLAKENEAALKSTNTDMQLKRVPPASLVAATGNQWKELPAEEKMRYEERARQDRKRYEEQMSKYQPPDKQINRKRSKTGYNMFFSAHVQHLKQSESGVPSERGSVARLVGNAWKDLPSERKEYYEREADKFNGTNSGDEEEDKDIDKRRIEYVPPAGPIAHMERGSVPPPLIAPVVHQPGHHDPRVYHPPPPPHHYPAYHYFDYHQPAHPPPPPPPNSAQRGSRARGNTGHHGYPPYGPPQPHYPHHYDQTG